MTAPLGASTAAAMFRLHDVCRVDRDTKPSHLVAMSFLTAQVEGHQPFVEAFELEAAVAPESILPEGAVIERAATTDTRVEALARTAGAAIHIVAYPRSVAVHVSARTSVEAASLAADIRRRIPLLDEPDTVSMRTWYVNRHGVGVPNDRRIAAPVWSDIARNYPASVRQDLQSLMCMVRPEGTGKLILWHGLPGTGKTTALRALMRSWEPWCAAQYISDPEQFFAEPAYIAQVLTRSVSSRHGPRLDKAGDPDTLWRLVVAEDSDEYLRASARRDAGAGLGRLLNLTDGVLGQGFKTLILLTTNEELQHIHPALTRPGRSLARVEFAAFGVAEAAEWLDHEGVPAARDMTLAELFEQRGSLSRLGSRKTDEPTIGQYL